jgi:hypothetical protein
MDSTLSTRFRKSKTAAAGHLAPAGRSVPRWRRLSVTTAGAVVLCGLLAAPAAAVTSRTVMKSTSFAGYIAGVSGTVSTFTGTVSVPTVTCPATGTMTLEPAVAIHTSGNYLLFDDFVTCSAGTKSSAGFTAAIFLATGGFDIASANLATAPNDVVKLQLTIAGSGAATMKISDATAKTAASATAPVTGSITSVQAGTSVFGGSPTVVPAFSPVAFGALKVGAASLASLTPAEYEIYNGAQLQLSTSKISKKGSFTNTFVHS